ncbi:MAG: RNA pyrophosphohydrolase [Halothiobacillaceae bacterium]|nr:MAG: RNA pyrophosphohydrolase [Halothiobacillaceae bacterium]
MIDSEGYRPNVGIILVNAEGRVFWARRVGQDAWQFPQGGIRCEESPMEAMFRELREETGLLPKHVRLLGCTRDWLRYRLPHNLVRKRNFPVCIGQKQKWFLLRMIGSDQTVQLDHGHRPEFDDWRWVDFWQPLRDVVAFKREVYDSALHEFAPLVFPSDDVRMMACDAVRLRFGESE